MARLKHCTWILTFLLVIGGCQGSQKDSFNSKTLANQISDRQMTLLAQRLKDFHYQMPITELTRLGIFSEESTGFALSSELVLTVPVVDHRNKLDQSEDVLFVTLPNQEDTTIEQLTAWDRHGHHLQLSASEPPAIPTIVIGKAERLPLASVSTYTEAPMDHPHTDQLLMLSSVSFENVKEPWFRGDAEIYAVVAYLDQQGQGRSELIALEGVTKAGRSYDLRKIIHHWPKNMYTILDVTFYEHDTNQSFKDLSLVLLSAAQKVSVVALPQFGSIAILISSVLEKVIKAIPDPAFKDSDDHLDTINTVELLPLAVTRYGVADNLQAVLTPYFAVRN